MKIDLVEYIAQRTPVSFIPRAIELLEEAYFEAYRYSETFDDPEKKRILGQLRHYRQNEAMRTAGLHAGLVAAAPHTDPKGERYSVVFAEDIRFSRIGVPLENSQPRPSAHRKVIAALNARLEPMNLSLFDPVRPVPQDGLGCLLVTVNPHSRDVQSVPAALMIGVPYTNLRGWHLLEPISTIQAAQHPAQDIDVPDLAWATLKKQLGDAEE